MTGVEERLARDIAAVVGGVVVTESDLRDAQSAISERIDVRRRRDRRRNVIVAVAAAVVVLVVGALAVRSLDGDDVTAPPADRGPSSSADPFAEFLVGPAPTSDGMRGVWRKDNGTTIVRFSSPNLVSFDDKGRIFDDPDVQGTYDLTGDRITVSVTGGRDGCAGQEIVLRASVPEPGIMRLVHVQRGTGNCSRAPNESWELQQVLPPSSEFTSFDASAEPGWGPMPADMSLYGSWSAQRGGYVLELARSGSYYVLDGSGDAVDQGQWSRRDSRITLTSSAESTECDEGDRLVLSDVETVNPGTPAIRSTVQENACGAPWATKSWFLIPYAGSEQG